MEWKIARRVLIVLGFGVLFCLYMLTVVSDLPQHRHHAEEPH